MKKLLISVALSFLVLFPLLAQEENEGPEPIITDRPDQTEASTTVPKGFFQIETGAMVEKDKVGGIETKEITYNTTLIKYGLTDRFELRIIQEFLATQVDGMRVSSGSGPLTLGTKIKMMDEHGIWPEMALLGHMTYRTGNADYKPSHVVPDFRFSMAHTLSDHLSLGYNLGAEWDGETATATGLYTLSLAIGLTDKLGIFLEVYGYMPDNSSADHRFDGGITYRIGNNFQFDVSGGVGLNDIAPDNFLSGGISWRLPR